MANTRIAEFTLDELLGMMREASQRYRNHAFGSTADDIEIKTTAALDIEHLTQRIREDYPNHYGR